MPDHDRQRDAGQEGAYCDAHVGVRKPACSQLLAFEQADDQHDQQQDVRTLEMTRPDSLPQGDVLGYRNVRDRDPLLDQDASRQQDRRCEVQPLPENHRKEDDRQRENAGNAARRAQVTGERPENESAGD